MGQKGKKDVSQDVIELDGNRYDAKTGANLGKSHVVPKHIADRYAQGRAIDGVVRPQAAKKVRVTKPEATGKQHATHQSPTPKNRIVIRNTANRARSEENHVRAHRPQHSKTLIRRTTHKPQFTMKTAISKASAPAEVMAKPQSALARKRSVYSVDQTREKRAAQTNKHSTIKHFSSPSTHTTPAQVPVIAVQPAPLHLITPQLAAPQPGAVQPVPKQHTDIFEAAIARANSHEQPAHKVRRRRSGKQRLVSTLAVIGTFLIIGGFVGYLNMPGIEMRIASVQAGFGASLPTYAPTGYSLNGRIERSGDTVSVSFRSGSSNYRITQQRSNWNSQTLLDNTLTLNGRYETVQRNGQTVYIYQDEGVNAAWVNGGVRYDLSGNAELSKDEIASIATSL